MRYFCSADLNRGSFRTQLPLKYKTFEKYFAVVSLLIKYNEK
jgi:hypothetical protein